MAEEVQAPESAPAVSSDVAPVTQGSSSDVPASTPAVTEKMVPQSVVDKVVGTRVKEAYEKARRETLSELQAKSPVTNQPAPSQMGGMQQMSPDQVRQMIQEEAWKMSNQAVAEKIANEFTQKIEATKQKYADFQEKYDKLNLNNHPQLVMWLNGLENTGDVIHDIASNPAKVASIMMLANGGFPDLARAELEKLSGSIKANEKANSSPQAKEPLSQIKPSTIGADNGSPTVTDLRKQPWLRA